MSAVVADLLDAAADRLERFGWMQGRLWSEEAERGRQIGSPPDRTSECPSCAIGALAIASGRVLGSWRAIDALAAVVSGDAESPVRRITDWNDAPGRTADEVVAKLREAASNERAADAQGRLL